MDRRKLLRDRAVVYGIAKWTIVAAEVVIALGAVAGYSWLANG